MQEINSTAVNQGLQQASQDVFLAAQLEAKVQKLDPVKNAQEISSFRDH